MLDAQCYGKTSGGGVREKKRGEGEGERGGRKELRGGQVKIPLFE